jgi:hypothetical protein
MVATSLKVGTQFAVVVNLAIEGDAELAVIGGHRLGAAIGEIDNREAAMGKADPSIVRNPESCTIGTAVDHRFANSKQFFAVNGWSGFAMGKDAGYAAHEVVDRGTWFVRRGSLLVDHGKWLESRGS